MKYESLPESEISLHHCPVRPVEYRISSNKLRPRACGNLQRSRVVAKTPAFDDREVFAIEDRSQALDAIAIGNSCAANTSVGN